MIRSAAGFDCALLNPSKRAQAKRRRREDGVVFFMGLESVTQGELHHARFGQSAAVGGEGRRRLLQLACGLRQRGYVEANRVGHVVYIPTKLQALRFADHPGFAERRVDAEVARAAKLVALSRFAGVGVAKFALSGGCVLEKIRIAILVDKCAGLWLRAVQDRGRREIPVCRETREGLDSGGEAAGPPSESGPLPATNDGVLPALWRGGESFAGAEGELINPVGVELVSGVEIGHAAKLGWGPRVNDLVGLVIGVVGVNSLGARTDVYRLRIGVVEVPLQPVGHAATYRHLQRVIRAGAGVSPGIERGELRIEEGI